MTAATATRSKTPIAGVHRTKTHQYYFNGQGPWPGVTSITKVLDAPALTYWKMNQVAQAAIAGRRAPDRGPRGRQDRRRGEVPHDPVDDRDGPRLPDPRLDRADPPPRARDDRPARRGRRRRRPGLAQRAGPRARPPAARGRGVPAPRDARLRRDVRPHRRARRRGLAPRLEDGIVRRHPGRHGVPRPPAPAGGLRERRVHRPPERPGAVRPPGDHPLRPRPRHRRRHAAVRGGGHPAGLDRLPGVPGAARLERRRRRRDSDPRD